MEIAASDVNPLVREALTKASVKSRADLASVYGQLLTRIYQESKSGVTSADLAVQELLAIVTSPDSPSFFPKSQTRRYMSRKETDAFGGKLKELDKLAVQEPQAPPRAMCLGDAPELTEPHVFIRGNPARPGERVSRHFLQVLSGRPPPPFRHGSGRLDLARAITAADNPLTSRVLVNRVWMHHFGEPLVTTPSDFGVRSSPPTHPELLDHLALTLQQQGWSLKQLHRHIMSSRTYQQASLDRPACRRVDPENRLLWHEPPSARSGSDARHAAGGFRPARRPHRRTTC